MKLVPTFALALFACSSTPVDFTGTYNVTLIDGANACGFANWTDGQATTNITVNITQDATAAQADVQGLVGLYLDVVAGTHIFVGTVSGDAFESTLIGKQTTQGSCSYHVNSELKLTISGNTVNGTITYTPLTNADPSCAALNQCSNVQTVSGTRPAK
jgi:hypothetical protein